MTKLQEPTITTFNLVDKESITVASIAPKGDVFLVVGPKELRLRVESVVLEAASRPFASLLSPKWREGREVADSNAIAEIHLPEDDVMGMECICAIIHHRHEFIPKSLSVSDILKIAVMVDKYDFIDAMKLTSGTLLVYENRLADELMTLMVAAFLFQNALAFRRITKSLLLDFGGSYLTISNESVESTIGPSVICLLEEQRGLARARVSQVLMDGYTTRICCHRCGWSSKYAFAYLQLLRDRKLMPTDIICISKAIEQVELLPDPIPEEASGDCVFAYRHTVPNYRIDHRREFDRLTAQIGLCLRCVKLGKTEIGFCSMIGQL